MIDAKGTTVRLLNDGVVAYNAAKRHGVMIEDGTVGEDAVAAYDEAVEVYRAVFDGLNGHYTYEADGFLSEDWYQAVFDRAHRDHGWADGLVKMYRFAFGDWLTLSR